jgi:hypothetical protein
VYLDKYPRGAFADLARQLIAQVKRESEARQAEAAERAAQAQRAEAVRKARDAEAAEQQDQLRRALEAAEAARNKADEEARAKAQADRQRLAMLQKQQEPTRVLIPQNVSCADQARNRTLVGAARTRFMTKCQACEKTSLDHNYEGANKVLFVSMCAGELIDKPLNCTGLANLFNLAEVDLTSFVTKCEEGKTICEKRKVSNDAKSNAYVNGCIAHHLTTQSAAASVALSPLQNQINRECSERADAKSLHGKSAWHFVHSAKPNWRAITDAPHEATGAARPSGAPNAMA